ncbi:MAG: DUF1643 domain-containing protein [Betaproteobacteria bacterium]|nr:DUF1643 domain-containing protein [Betaproteobacteria bacterium]
MAARVSAPADCLRATAAQLLAQWAVYGHYYRAPIGPGPHAPMEDLRDRLEIAPHGWTLAEVDAREPDLLVIMMNPGASKPLEALWDGGNPADLVPAQPDRTQYQIMRLLLAAQAAGLSWRHARVFNLSDLRTPKSAEMLAKLDLYGAHDRHSLFSLGRQAECARWFAHHATPVLCGWGLNPGLADLATRALRAAAGHPLLGLSDDGLRFRHPLPQTQSLQHQWLRAMVDQICAIPKT